MAVYKKLFCLLFAAILLLSGCGRNERGGGKEDYAVRESSREQESGADSAQEDIQGESSGSEDEALTQVIFEGKDMEGNTVTSSIFEQSKLTMVNVWATYCSPCLNEIPDLNELAQEYDAEDFQLIGIVGDVAEGGDEDDIDLVEELIYLIDVKYTNMLVNESLYSAFMKDLRGVPTTFFINEQGEILDTVEGAREKEVWKELIDGLLEDL